MKTFLKWLGGIILALFLVYIAGPKPSKPDFTIHEITLPSSLTELERRLMRMKRMSSG